MSTLIYVVLILIYFPFFVFYLSGLIPFQALDVGDNLHFSFVVFYMSSLISFQTLDIVVRAEASTDREALFRGQVELNMKAGRV